MRDRALVVEPVRKQCCLFCGDMRGSFGIFEPALRGKDQEESTQVSNTI